MRNIVIALGGNALQEAGKPATAQNQLEVVNQTCAYIADIIKSGYHVTLAHGNGPQVGRIISQQNYAVPVSPAMPFDVCSAMSQGMIGYHLQQGMRRALRARGMDTPVTTIVTQVVVDGNDPGFQNPTKPIGAFYTPEEVAALKQVNPHHVFKEDTARGGWRRVVASPEPLEIVELEAIKRLAKENILTITVGGGGIPVVREADGNIHGVAAVIDKDFASEKLAEELDADALVILTAVEKISINYKKPDQRDLDTLTVAQAEDYIAQGQFPAGSMLPKVQAALRFVKSKPGRVAVVTSLDKAVEALAGKAGTILQ